MTQGSYIDIYILTFCSKHVLERRVAPGFKLTLKGGEKSETRDVVFGHCDLLDATDYIRWISRQYPRETPVLQTTQVLHTLERRHLCHLKQRLYLAVASQAD